MSSPIPVDRLAWWQRGIIYQIYPRSFQDTNGDGVGDLAGIRRRLDHLAWLGVDALWISPIYPSPMADFGYDVADYCAVDPLFGSIADFDALVREAHGRGLKLILDFVPNHTSDQHAWFRESRASRQSPKRDWYIWRDARPDGSPPNNWVSNFGGSAWEWDEATGQYYYHAFLKEQPDLNWRNPAVREAMSDVLRFWMRKGVDGFRVDAITYLVEDRLLRENPPNPLFTADMPPPQRQRQNFNADRPEAHGYAADMREVIDEFPDRVLIGEAYLPIERVVKYYGQNRPGFNLPFNFELIETPWNARSIEAAIDRYIIALPDKAWPNWVLGNHDKPRVANRIGEAQARVAAMLQMTLRGTPFVYNGDELGLSDVPVPADRIQDPFERRLPGFGLGRDPQRAPIPWDDGPHAGFTTGDPWLPIGLNAGRDVAAEQKDPRSFLTLYRQLIALRRAEPTLIAGTYEPIADEGDVLAFERERDGRRIFVALNLGGPQRDVRLPGSGRVLLSTHCDRDREAVDGATALRTDEGLVILIEGE